MNTMPELRTLEPTQRENFNVLGSGIIGLTTALTLASEGHDVTVHSREGKPTIGHDSTSSNAIGQFLPWVPAEHAEALLGGVQLEEVTEFSRQYYAELADNPHETGVAKVSNVELLLDGGEWPEGLPSAMHADERALEKAIPFVDPDGKVVDCTVELTFDTFSINTKKTIAYLADLAEKSGVKFVQGNVTLHDLDKFDGIIINALGVGAPEIDKEVESGNFKGHTFVIKPEEGYMPAQALSVEDLIIMPREDGTVICGALYIENPDRILPKEEEAAELFDRLGKLLDAVAEAGVVEGLEPGLLEHSEVLRHSAGYRVELKDGGIRVAPDERNQRLLHAYGFGGLGWSVGPHFAKRIANEAHKLHSLIKE